jgi:hypothetical protein
MLYYYYNLTNLIRNKSLLYKIILKYTLIYLFMHFYSNDI